jgi:hypothetical protein
MTRQISLVEPFCSLLCCHHAHLSSARVILGGIELIHMMRKQQAKYACSQQLRSPSSFTCSPHEGGTMHLLFSRPCSEVATEPSRFGRS